MLVAEERSQLWLLYLGRKVALGEGVVADGDGFIDGDPGLHAAGVQREHDPGVFSEPLDN